MWTEKYPHQPARWPDGVRLPIMVSVHHQSEEATCPLPDGQPDPFDYGERQYGARRGAWRLLEIMEKHQIRGTWLICGATLEKYPEVARAVRKAGHCIAGHTYAHEMMCNLPRHTELNLIKKTVSVFEDLLGEHIQGWRTCFASHDTVNLILEHSDFAWDGSMWNDDLPSIIEGYGRELLEIPFATYSDTALGVDITSAGNPPTRYSTWNANTPEFMFRGWKAAFDALYERSGERAVMMPLVAHDFITGRPFRSKALDDFIAYAKQFEGVVFTAHDQVASWWRDLY
jgi:peptidoglycan/xylan/chitin deacetylase (PgdA/CDA1 family)